MTKAKANKAVAESTDSSVSTVQDWWYKPPNSPALVLAHAVLKALWSGKQVAVGFLRIKVTVDYKNFDHGTK